MECKDGVCQVPSRAAEAPAAQQPELALAVFEASGDALTLEWAPREGGLFVVEMATGAAEDGGESAWRVLSDKVSGSFLRKRNLAPGETYRFRVKRAKSAGSGDSGPGESSPVLTATMPPAEAVPAAPKVDALTAQADGNFVATVSWASAPEADCYAVQVRRMLSAPSLAWTTLSESLKGAAVRKKNLPPADDYVFRYRAQRKGAWGAWSAVSKPAACRALAPCFTNLFGDSLLRGTESVSSGTLAGKTIMVLFSGPSWCPPCRALDGKLVPFMQSVRAAGLALELVFVSAERDVSAFHSVYGAHTPWLAVPYGSPKREAAMQSYQISGVPNLKVFAPDGRLIVDNAAGMPLTLDVARSWLPQ